jgi:hypothetical protein
MAWHYFRDDADGYVYSHTSGDAHPAFAEVQVVPLDAIVIRREDLPEVVWVERLQRWETVPDERGIWAERDADPEYYERRAEEYAAMARHLRNLPPVDPEVERHAEALNGLIVDAACKGLVGITAAADIEFERYLVKRGVRVETQP